MFGRHSLVVLSLAAAAGVPYVMSNARVPAVFSGDGSHSAEHGETAVDSHDADGPGSHSLSGSGEVTDRLSGPAARSLAEILRFDVTPDWIMSRWPRVSTDLPYPKLQGYRVPLVTGTGEHDLAGSLTYYFDPQQQVQQITFYGTTGNWRRLAAFLTQQYAFEQRVTKDPSEQLFVFTHFDRTLSWCRIRPVKVISAGAPHTRYKVSLNMQRPPLL